MSSDGSYTDGLGVSDSASWVLTGPDGKIKRSSDPAEAVSTTEEDTDHGQDSDC